MPYELHHPARLEALRELGLPDARPEASFDRLARWALRVAGSAGAYISFLDASTQTFKSAVGLQPPVRTLDVCFSACALVVQGDEPIVVDDVALDATFATHPITGLGVRAYLGVPLRTDRGLPLGTICVVDTEPHSWTQEDVGLLEELGAMTMREVELRRMARTDALTGLANRRAFDDDLEEHVALAASGEDERLALALLDLDRFKAVNDREGHAAGDAVLVAVSACLAQQCRAGEQLARLGGDELALVLPGGTLASALTAAERMRAAVAELELGVTVSAGVGAWSPGMSADALTRVVDRALYAAKDAGGDRTVVAGASAATARRSRPALLDDVTLLSRLAQAPQLDVVLDAVNELLGTQVSYVARMTDEEQVFLRVRGDGASFGIGDDSVIPIDDTYCQHVLAGRIANVINDVRGHELTGPMPVTEAAGVGAFASVPLTLSGGEQFGTLCCASHDVREDLGPRDLAVLHLAARIAAADIERRRQDDEARRRSTRDAGVRALAAAVSARDKYTGSHADAVVRLAGTVGRRLGLDPQAVTHVEDVALLHDVGKLSIPDEILHCDGPLDDGQWAIMRQHPVASEAIIATVPELAAVAKAVRSEHERWDGGGYPDGLRAEAIPLAARIALACDAYHAMTSDRPYRLALEPQRAKAELARHAGTQFDPEVVAVLLEVLG